MNNILSTAALALCVLVCAPAARAQQIVTGTVSQVMDGDTLRMGDQKIRLWGADALERTQTCINSQGRVWACGEAARAALADAVMAKTITCTVRGTSYDRLVARCESQGVDLSQMMVRAGWSFDCARYSRSAYAQHQRAAQADAVGVWGHTFEWPWLARPRPGSC